MPISHRVWLQNSPATPRRGRSLLYREDSANKQRPPFDKAPNTHVPRPLSDVTNI